MLKKITSLIILTTFIFSMFTGVIVYAEKDYSLLNKIGVSIDTEKLDEPISRIELAKMAIQLNGINLIKTGKAEFIDVPEKHKYFSVVNTVCLNGLMQGYSDGTFRPDADAAADDVSGMVLTMLGYSTDIPFESKQIIAKNIGILNGVSNGTLTNRSLGNIFLNMLDSYIVNPVFEGDNVVYEKTSKTYQEKMMGYETVEGIVQAVGKASVYGAEVVGYGKCLIDGEEYGCEDIDMLQYLGLKVQAVMNDGDIISVSVKGKIDEKNILAKDITGYDNYTYQYTENDGSKSKSITMSPYARIIFNGKNMIYDENLMLPQEGDIRFVKTGIYSGYDLVIISSAIYIKVQSYEEEEVLIDSLVGSRINLDGVEIECYSNGKKVDSSALVKDSWVRLMPDKMIYETVNDTVVLSPDTNNCEYVRCEIVPQNVSEGEVTALSGDTVTVANEKIEIQKNIISLINGGKISKPALGSYGKFYKNENDELLGFVVESRLSGGSIKYGYLLRCFQDDENDRISFKVINEQAQQEVLTGAENLKINGKKITNIDVLQNDTDTSNSKIFVNGTLKKQLIGYELDSDGNVKKLHVAKDYANEYILNENGENTTVKNPDYRKSGYIGYDEENFSLNYNTGVNNDLYRSGIRHLYSFTDSTVGFKIPLDVENYNKYEVLLSNAKSLMTYNNSYRVSLFNVNRNFEIGAYIVDFSQGGKVGINTRLENGYNYYVDEAYDEWSEEDDEVRTVLTFKYFDKNGFKSENIVCNDPELVDGDTRMVPNPFGKLKWKELGPGDAIIPTFDDDNNLLGFAVVMDYSTLYNSDGTVNYRAFGILEGSYLLTVSKVIAALDNGNYLLSYSGDDDYTKFFTAELDSRLALYENGRYSQMNSSDIRVGDTIYTRSYGGQIRDAVIYR